MQGSYVIIQRERAEHARRVLAWVAEMMANSGPSWHRHERDLRLAAAELEDAIAMSRRLADAAAARRSA